MKESIEHEERVKMQNKKYSSSLSLFSSEERRNQNLINNNNTNNNDNNDNNNNNNENGVEYAENNCGFVFFISSNNYFTCTAVAIYSLKFWAKTNQPIILMVGEGVSSHLIDYLITTLDINVFYINYVENPNGIVKNRFQNNYSKMKLFQLTQFQKLIYFDSDFLILRNSDDLCDLSSPFASSTNYESKDSIAEWTKKNYFNAGFFVADVTPLSFDVMNNASRFFESPTGGDQPFMNHYFKGKWFHLDKLIDGANGNVYYQHRDLWQDLFVRSIHFTLHINPCVQSKSWNTFYRYLNRINEGKSDEFDPIYLWYKARDELLARFPGFNEYFWRSQGGYHVCDSVDYFSSPFAELKNYLFN